MLATSETDSYSEAAFETLFYSLRLAKSLVRARSMSTTPFPLNLFVYNFVALLLFAVLKVLTSLLIKRRPRSFFQSKLPAGELLPDMTGLFS